MKQHAIPRCYLKAWCDPSTPKGETPYVWMFTKEGRSGRRKAPENIFREKDMYTIEKADGKHDLVLERGLSQLESEFASIRNRTLRRNHVPDATEHIKICAFVAAMTTRTKASREHHRKQWGHMLSTMEDMKKWAETATSQEKRLAAALSRPSSSSKGSFTYEDVKLLAERPLQIVLPAMIQAATPLLCRLDLAVLSTTDSVGFITSDDPCVWFDPEAYKRPPLYRGPGLVYETIEITLPVSPEQYVYLNRQGISGYIAVGDEVVDNLNSR